MKRLLLTLFALTAVLGILPRHAQSQDRWQLLTKFDRPVGSVYFMDENTGFIGSGLRPVNIFTTTSPNKPVRIYKTTDGGQTWLSTRVPREVPGAITSVFMMDAANGYASVFSDIRTEKPAIWRTSDGGETWTDELSIWGLGTSVYRTSKALIYTDWNDRTYGGNSIYGGAVLDLASQSWQFLFRPRANGIDFVDDQHGVITQINNQNALNFWYTADGGLTWKPSSPQYEAWSVYGVKGTSMFFVANESQDRLEHSTVNWSTDYGETWTSRYQLPGIRFTGHIHGKGKTLYFQTDTVLVLGIFSYGLYRSDDLGATWKCVYGPWHSRDTRAFYATGCSGEVVYALGADSCVYKTTGGGDGTLKGGHPDYADFAAVVDTVRIQSTSCVDTAYVGIVSTGCADFRIESATLPTGTPLTSLLIGGARTIHENEVAKAMLVFRPSDTGSGTTRIEFKGKAGSRTITREVVVIYEHTEKDQYILTADTLTFVARDCQPVYNATILAAYGCQPLTVDSITVDKGELTLQTPAPFTLDSTTVKQIHFKFTPDSSGLRTVQVRVHGRTGKREIDTVITIILDALLPAPALVFNDSLLFASTFCKPDTKTIAIENTGCDDFVVDRIDLLGDDYSLTSTPPDSLSAGTTLTLDVLYAPVKGGPSEGTVRLRGHNRAGLVDTLITLRGMSDASDPAWTIPQDTLQLATSACKPLSGTLRMLNLGCEPFWVDSVIGPGGEFLLTSGGLNDTLFSGSEMPLTVLFSPTGRGSREVAIRIFAHTPKRRIDTTIFVLAHNDLPASIVELVPGALRLNTSYCQPITLPIDVTNHCCSPLEVTSMTLMGDARGEFSATSAFLDGALPSLTTGRINVTFTPDSSGERTATLRIVGTSSDRSLDTTIFLTGKNVTAPEPYLLQFDSAIAGSVVPMPVYLRPTTDTFAITRYVVHLGMELDLLTPFTADFANSLSSAPSNYRLDLIPGKGATLSVELARPITQEDDLTQPLVRILAKAYLSSTRATPVTLDTFAVLERPEFAVCMQPVSSSGVIYLCGDGVIADYLKRAHKSVQIAGIYPNPVVKSKAWIIDYAVAESIEELVADVVDIHGRIVSSQAMPWTKGRHRTEIAAPATSGDYVIHLRSSDGSQAVKAIVR